MSSGLGHAAAIAVRGPRTAVAADFCVLPLTSNLLLLSSYRLPLTDEIEQVIPLTSHLFTTGVVVAALALAAATVAAAALALAAAALTVASAALAVASAARIAVASAARTAVAHAATA